MDQKGLAALRRLEKQVGQAAKKLHQLREENRELRNRIEELEFAPAPNGNAAADEVNWVRQRSELHRRVQRLSDGLGKLLEL